MTLEEYSKYRHNVSDQVPLDRLDKIIEEDEADERKSRDRKNVGEEKD